MVCWFKLFFVFQQFDRVEDEHTCCFCCCCRRRIKYVESYRTRIGFHLIRFYIILHEFPTDSYVKICNVRWGGIWIETDIPCSSQSSSDLTWIANDHNPIASRNATGSRLIASSGMESTLNIAHSRNSHVSMVRNAYQPWNHHSLLFIISKANTIKRNL